MSKDKLGKNWSVKRVSDIEASVALPEGMKFTSEDLTIEDIIEAYQEHKVLHRGEISGQGGGEPGDHVSLRCCSGNTAIAVL